MVKIEQFRKNPAVLKNVSLIKLVLNLHKRQSLKNHKIQKYYTVFLARAGRP